jgi:hypothetical protein
MIALCFGPSEQKKLHGGEFRARIPPPQSVVGLQHVQII